jgi:hypothetical protein
MKIIDSDAGSGKTLCAFSDVARNIREGTMPSYLVYFTVAGGIQTAVSEATYFGLKTNILIPLKTKTRNIEITKGVVNIIKYDHARIEEMEDALLEIAPDAFVIFDEFDTVLNPCKKTSVALDMSRRAKRVIAMSATILKDRHIEYLIPWLQQVVSFRVTYSNIWNALGATISKRVDYGIDIVRKHIEASFTVSEEILYENLMSRPEDGRLSPTDFRRAVELCFSVCLRRQIDETILWLKTAPVLLVVRKKEEQIIARDLLMKKGLKEEEIALIGEKGVSTTYIEGDGSKTLVAITTIFNTRSYTATKMGVLIQSVFFVSEATRIQTIGRVKRQTQRRKEIYEVTVHVGVLSKVLERYDSERSMIDAARSISDIVGGDLVTSWH